MPKRTDIKSIMIIGAGPIVIGQACEFDYSGAQACKALRAEGYRVVLVNSNPATIMTDPQLADATYIEPITPFWLTQIIKKERPDALLPTMGGQTALNAAMALAQDGTLKKYKVELIGAKAEAIHKAENREAFRSAMQKIGLDMPRSAIARNLTQAKKALETIGVPAIIRPSFTLGGTGGGFANSKKEFLSIVANGLAASPTNEVLIEESIVGWKEYEMEVIRDKKDNCIIVCSIENIDPMGVHTGDSITVAPALTLTDKEYQQMRSASLAVLREVGVETGGSNVQFATNPKTGRQVVIEMNPRVSRSSALASKATGFPIAKVAALLAVGYCLHELQNDISPTMPASFEPMLDYVVTKIPRFAFEKFPNATPVLGPSMQSVGEAMAIGRNFAESLQKALCSLETGLTGLNPCADAPKSVPAMTRRLRQASPDRLRLITDAVRLGMKEDAIAKASGFDIWFVRQLAQLVAQEKKIKKLPRTADEWRKLKAQGFSDARIAELAKTTPVKVRTARHKAGVRPHFHRIDSCAGEFPATTPYLYSSYEPASPFAPDNEGGDEVFASTKKKVAILGGGPNRIGQGIEFDYCCCHAAYALKEAGVESIMINCNPETVSTDYDTADRLYFEPLTDEHTLEVLHAEQRKGKLLGAIVQFGGQTPLNRIPALVANKIPILGTPAQAIDLAEDRKQFQTLLARLNIQQPPNGTATSLAQAKKIAKRIGYPLVIRPSYVLGGRAMEIVHNESSLTAYMKKALALQETPAPILLDRYLGDAIEVDIDVLADKQQCYIAGILQHIEEAGVHSGDSACVLPPHSLPPAVLAELSAQAKSLAKGLGVVGLMNAQFAVQGDAIYVLEANPRASRTVPFIAKVLGLALPALATDLMLGKSLAQLKLPKPNYTGFAVKEAVLPFTRFADTDTLLGPEMRSTGEVMGWAQDFPLAYAKSQQASYTELPQKGCVFLSVRDSDKQHAIALAKKLHALGFTLLATKGTYTALREAGIRAKSINKVREGSPHIVEALEEAKVQLVLNTTHGAQSILDSKSIRRTALMQKIPYCTTIAAAYASVEAIATLKNLDDTAPIRKLQA